MASSVASGTQTAVINTEHTLYTTASAGTYVLSVDLTNMQNGDRLELRLKRKVLTASTVKGMYVRTYNHAYSTDEVVVDSVAVICPFGITVTLKQVAGTGRAFEWSVNIP